MSNNHPDLKKHDVVRVPGRTSHEDVALDGDGDELVVCGACDLALVVAEDNLAEEKVGAELECGL